MRAGVHAEKPLSELTSQEPYRPPLAGAALPSPDGRRDDAGRAVRRLRRGRRGPQGNRTPLLPTFSNQGWPQSSRFLGGWIRQFMAPVGSFYLIIIRPDGPRWCSLSLVTSYFLLLVLNGLVTLWLMIGYTRTGKLI